VGHRLTFIWRFTRDFISVPAPLDDCTALQLCCDYTQSFISPQNAMLLLLLKSVEFDDDVALLLSVAGKM